MNIWQRYEQERGRLMHFVRLATTHKKRSAREKEVLARIFAKYSPILNFFPTNRLSNEPFLIWLLTTSPHLKYVATLPCNCC